MTQVNIHILLCCLVVALSWGSVVERDNNASPWNLKAAVQQLLLGEHKAATRTISYGIVCDAGSTSTRLKVYQVNRTGANLAYPRIDLIHSKTFLPSLDAFVNNKSGLIDQVTQILVEAKKIVPVSQLSETTAYFLATAQVRMLEPYDASQLIKEIIQVFDSFNISHFRRREGINVLSGEEEGAFSWVAANYLLGNFANNSPDDETVGVLEMGGGSTQIVFIPKDPIYGGEFQITINQRVYNLYVHSYLQFGSNSILRWVAKVLSQTYPGSLDVGNPCMLTGDVKEIQVENDLTLLLHGTSDPERCQTILQQILASNKGLECSPKPCAIGNVYQPSVDDIKFYAIQGFTHSPIAFNILGSDQVLNIDLLELEAFKYCRKNLTEAVEAGADVNYASINCLMGIYSPTLTTLSYGFPRSTKNIKVTNKIEGKLIEWTLGVMVLDVFDYTMTRRKR